MSDKKFTDEEFLRFYNQKKSDREIAKILRVNHSSVNIRRNRLNLPVIATKNRYKKSNLTCDRILKNRKKYVNPLAHRRAINNYYKRNIRINLKFTLTRKFRTFLNHALRGRKQGTKNWEILGYNLEKFKKRLENQFSEGMSWDNYGVWEIDHIVPVFMFDYDSIEDRQFKICWSLYNLRPLFSKDNKKN
jgi:hypothetical protein